MPPTRNAVVNEVKQVHTAEVVRHGTAVVVPDDMPLASAVDILQRRMAYEKEVVKISETINVFPWDGALALARVMEEKFGFSTQEKQRGFFQDNPPELRSVEVGPEETLLVPWGQFSLPGVEGSITTGVDYKNNQFVFMVHAQVRRQHEKVIKELLYEVRAYLKEHSIYRSKALKIRFTDDNGHHIWKDNGDMIEPRFLDLSKVSDEDLIFSEEIDREFKHYVLCPIERRNDTNLHVPSKRGVLLGGLPGTGKTLATMVAAKKAIENGLTVVYCENIKDLQDVVKFAIQYAPSIVVCEDIDRVVGAGKRDLDVDRHLNIMDGMETKKADLKFLLTTNNAEVIQQPMMRPGRIDVFINVPPPDAQAVEKLVRLYGKGFVSQSEDLRDVGRVLAGAIPAVIGEVVQRAKLSAIYHSQPGETNLSISSGDLLVAAKSMAKQLKLLNRAPEPILSDLEKAAHALGGYLPKNRLPEKVQRAISGNGQVEAEDLTPLLGSLADAEDELYRSKD